MAAKECPNCALVHPASATRCECGYDFRSGKQRERTGRERPVEQWHENPLVAAALLLICWPAGIVLTWRNRKLSWEMKALLTFAWFALFAVATFFRMQAAANRNN
jgi:hypothetical protein